MLQECDKSKVTEEQARLVDKHVIEGHLSGLDAKRYKGAVAFKSQRLIEKQYHFRIRLEV